MTDEPNNTAPQPEEQPQVQEDAPATEDEDTTTAAASETETPNTTPEPTPAFGWTAYAERINGRFAMVGFVALLLLELFTHQDFFTWIGLFS